MAQVEFHYKGKGRIFVFDSSHISRVENIIKKMDEFEYGYLPSDLITVYDNNISDLVYIGKFDIDILELIKKCGNAGIGIFVRSVPIETENYFL